VCVVIPAWNEARVVAGLIRSLRSETDPQLAIVLALDRCTDDTAALARAAIAGDTRFEIVEMSLAGYRIFVPLRIRARIRSRLTAHQGPGHSRAGTFPGTLPVCRRDRSHRLSQQGGECLREHFLDANTESRCNARPVRALCVT
jgi:glycosyltransferase involved in cell wall biosynthesis